MVQRGGEPNWVKLRGCGNPPPNVVPASGRGETARGCLPLSNLGLAIQLSGTALSGSEECANSIGEGESRINSDLGGRQIVVGQAEAALSISPMFEEDIGASGGP